MNYTVKGHILGFENTNEVEIVEIDELFASMKDVENENISFTLVNPYMLREYSFDVPSATKALLELNEDSNVKVYNIVVIQKPLEESKINFLAPIIVNEDNKTLAQVVLDPKTHPDFSMAESIKDFIKED
jgi:flagellar assembly factor FliW